MREKEKNKNFSNPEYVGEERQGERGVEYFVRRYSECEWTQVSEEVFDFLRTDYWAFQKKLYRDYKRNYFMDTPISKNDGNNYSVLKVLEAVYPQMSSLSAEDEFCKENLFSNLHTFVEKLGQEWLDLFYALFILRIPASDYAKQIGQPASTVRSKKACLKKEIKNFLKNF